MKIYTKVSLFVLGLLVLDQCVKLWIKTNMSLGEYYEVFSWFKILFVENNGMAFGFEFGGEKWGKAALSIFRIFAVTGIAWYIYKLIKDKAPRGVIYCFAAIFAGAIGNIIDSLFYGMIFNHSNGQVATMFAEEGGYSDFLHGKVVDMLYFPLIDTTLPSWLPIWGGEHFSFFDPVFNFADSYISVSLFVLILFFRKYFAEEGKK